MLAVVRFAAGHYYNGTKTVACYWGAGGTRTDISDVPSTATNVYAESIYVDGSTIYIAGYYGNGATNTPCYWVNGSRQDLTIPVAPPDVTDAWAKAIYVSNGTVYTAGAYHNGSKFIACYWKGTSRTDLSPEANEGYGNSIFVIE